MMVEYPYCGNFFTRLWMVFWYGWIKGMRLIIDMTASPSWIKDPKLIRSDKFTDLPQSEICSKGYKIGKGFHDNLMWMFVPVFVKLNNFTKFDITVKDKNGYFLYSQDTAGTLNDSMVSDNDAKFIKGMGKAALPSMDLQTMIMIIIIGAGAVFGLHVLGLF